MIDQVKLITNDRLDRLDREIGATGSTLAAMQRFDGTWPWFARFHILIISDFVIN